MSLYSILIAALAAVILFLNFSVSVTAFLAAAIIVIVIVSAITGYTGTRRV